MKSKKIKSAFYSLSVVPTFIALSCGNVSSAQTAKSQVKDSEDYSKEKTKVTSQEKQDKISLKKQEYLKTLIDELNKENILDAQKVSNIFNQKNIKVILGNGTSKRTSSIGDKYGDITNLFIPRFKKLTDSQKEKLNFESFSLLFQDENNKKYGIASSVLFVLEKGFKATYPELFEEKKQEESVEVKEHVLPRSQIEEYVFKDSSSLKYNDSWWDIKGLSYQNQTRKVDGKTFYADLNLESGKYPQFNLEDWINVYDTSISNVLSDPKHKYGAKSPSSYSASNIQFANVYHHHKELGKFKTGQNNGAQNNNPLNGFYSGANFVVDAQNKARTYDTSTVETLDNLYFTPDKQISNGWEHVSPQSHTENVWGKNSQIAKKANGDLHNIRPSIQNLFNGPRGNLLFGMVQGDTNSYGVDFEIGNSSFNVKVVEPRVNVRGDIARIMFYMHDRYHITYDLDYYKQLTLWAAMDPVTEEEKALDTKIADIMGFSNDYVTGKKVIPYYEDIKIKVDQANSDQSSNEKAWKIAPQKTVSKQITTVSQAHALDWNKGIDVPYGTSPSRTTGLKEAINQIILKVIMQNDNVKYFKVTGTQNKAILAKDLETNIICKIATNDRDHNPKRLKTRLSGGTNIDYTTMTDLIKSIKYLIVE